VIIVEREQDGSFYGRTQNPPGCYAAGRTVLEVVRLIRASLPAHRQALADAKRA